MELRAFQARKGFASRRESHDLPWSKRKIASKRPSTATNDGYATVMPGMPQLAPSVFSQTPASSLFLPLLEANPQSDKAEVSLTVVRSCRAFKATRGAVGLAPLRRLTTQQWDIILDDADETQALIAAFADVLSGRPLPFSPDLADYPGDDVGQQLLSLVWSDEGAFPREFGMIVATSFLTAHVSDPEFFNRTARDSASTNASAILASYCARLGLDAERASVGETLFARLKDLAVPIAGRRFALAALVEAVLDALGAFAMAPDEGIPTRRAAFAWCWEFYAGFGTFVDREASLETQAAQKDADRRILLKAQSALAALYPAEARQIFFTEAFAPLDSSFDPRVDKNLAHNAYYRRIGAAERMAQLAGKPKLAFKRRLDEENNEWGRVAEKAVRENEVFRLEFLKEAHAAIDPEAAERIRTTLKTFDRNGVLTRNLVFAHVLRCLYAQRGAFDPSFVPVETFVTEYVASLDLETLARTRLPTHIYETEAKEFDAWLLKLKRDNPDFFERLGDAVREYAARGATLPIDVMFMEVNEVEFYQYELDPESGPAAMLDFVGTIRSWTSGYHGRVLTRMRAFMAQDSLRKDKAAHPDSYKRPGEYYAEFADVMSRERFEATILPILNAGETNSEDPASNFPEAEALRLLSYFDSTRFSAYLPQWLVFIINHRFALADGTESLVPMREAFKLLATAGFPRELMRELFAREGYLNAVSSPIPSERARQEVVREASLACLKKLPKRDPIPLENDKGGTESIRSQIRRAGKSDVSIMPETYAELKAAFTADTVGPGEYTDYRRQARALLRTHDLDAIRTILNEALTDKELEYPANAPMRPLFPGLLGFFVTNATLEKALYAIATSSSSSGRGIASLIDFSSLMIRWARRRHVDLTRVFTEAFADYEVPESVLGPQRAVLETRSRLEEVNREIAELKTRRSLFAAFAVLPEGKDEKARLEELEREKRVLEADLSRREDERDAAIVALSRDPALMPEQALFQLITSIYNSVRRQYLKEVLITGGEITARLIETYLTDVLIPRQAALAAAEETGDAEVTSPARRDVERRIGFLTDVLAQMETAE